MQWQHVENGTRRAVRFPIAVPLHYRLAADSEWCKGESVNISGSGVLFWADGSPPLRTPVEISLTLPIVAAGAAVRFDFKGQVVRALAPVSQDGRTAVAATIVEYRFVRTGKPEDDQAPST